MAKKQKQSDEQVFQQVEDERGRLIADRPFTGEEAAAQDAENRKLLEEMRGVATLRTLRTRRDLLR